MFVINTGSSMNAVLQSTMDGGKLHKHTDAETDPPTKLQRATNVMQTIMQQKANKRT